MKRTFVLVGIALFATPARLAAQAPQPPSTPPSVTFHTEVDYVDVDTIVTDREGHFVPGLTKDDFDVFEDGKPQKVDTFSLVNIPVERQDRFLALGRPVTPDVRSNRTAFAGHVYVIVLDDLDVSPIRSVVVRTTARGFIEKYFGANDIGAVVYTSGRSDAVQDFTTDAALLVSAIDKFMGRKYRSAVLETLDKYYQRQLGADTADDSAALPVAQSERRRKLAPRRANLRG